MKSYRFAHLANRTLLDTLHRVAAENRAGTADLVALIAEVDSRRLFRPAGYSSMFEFCVHELRLSEDEAGKRVHAARAARRFPMIFPALADGRLHLTAVNRLRPYLTESNAEELIVAAYGKTTREIEFMVAERFPQPDVPTSLRALPSVARAVQAVSAAAGAESLELGSSQSEPLVTETPIEFGEPAPEQVPDDASSDPIQPAPEQVRATSQRPSITPLAPQRFALKLTMEQSTHEKLRRAQALLGHRIASGDIAQVLDLALDALLAKLEKRKFAQTDRPQKPRATGSGNRRYIPANVRRAVWERDGGRCTFTSATGKRCTSAVVEFDHVDPVARGGKATVSGIRLRCRPHNQYTAECDFGEEFMRQKRASAADRDDRVRDDRTVSSEAVRSHSGIVRATP